MPKSKYFGKNTDSKSKQKSTANRINHSKNTNSKAVLNGITAVLTDINGTFGFAQTNEGERFFIPGRCLCGAMPGDTVTLQKLRGGKGTTDEAEIVSIESFGDGRYTGCIESFDGYAYIRPDIMPRELITVSAADVELFEGDKVLFEIAVRGRRHSDHQANVREVFGDSEKAAACAKALLAVSGVPIAFSEETIKSAKESEARGIPKSEYAKRLDLRDRLIFTIDGADTMDIDDAVSIRKIETGWELGVHIADVSYYVRPDTVLDKSAFERGTSIYYANKVIPMLPKELSNGVCSLNPHEDRLAFSCLMRLDEKGKLGLFKFSKTIINSRVKGVYSEINKILSSDRETLRQDKELSDKYNGLYGTIISMNELADLLIARRMKRGAPEIETVESKIILDENDVCVDVKNHERGKAERIIEEFMLMANTAAAKLAKECKIPFVYRIHEKPAEQKVKDLSAFLLHVGVNPPPAVPEPRDMSRILMSVSEETIKPAVNMMVLRTLAKAKYFEEPIGHYGLALDDYAHFTSPIRRYSDLAVHRILTEYCVKHTPPEKIEKDYGEFAKAASLQSSKTEIRAVDIERKTSDIFTAEYLKNHLGDVFDGVIMTVLKTGFFAELPNTAEGFVRLDSLPNPPYDYDGYISLTKNGKRIYTVGDKVSVQVAKVDVPLARVDFVIAE
jgi:ribonuclease R